MAILEVKNISKTFDGFQALEGLELAVDPGTIWAIIGPNGAGKSTLFNLICGLQNPSTGEIYFKDVRLNGMKPNRRTALGMALTFQNLRLLEEYMHEGLQLLKLIEFFSRDPKSRNYPKSLRR